MNHPTDTMLDDRDMQHGLQNLSCQLEEAVAQADAERIRHLMFKRQQLLYKICATDTPAQLSPARRAELLHETQRWLATLQAHQQRLSTEIDRIRTRRNTKRSIFRAYRPGLPTTHGLRQRG